MSGQAAVAGALSMCADETRVFFDILTHDDHNSNYILARCAAGHWSERAVRAGEYGRLAFPDRAAYYLTRNGFTGKKRLTGRARQVNALMYDVDCHGHGGATALPDLTATFYDAFNDGRLPQPSLFVFTGRGLHLYYVLEKATPCRVRGGAENTHGLKYLRDVESGLAARIAEVASAIPEAEVDSSVYDLTRVSRVPGSWNEKAGCACTLLSYNNDFYTLEALKAYRCALVVPPRPGKGAQGRGRIMRFDRLMSARLRKVEQLQAHRLYDCEGSRENMCFVYYNTATQIYGSDGAYEKTLAFNQRFKRPLPETDINSIKRTVDAVVIEHGSCKGQKGFYPLSAKSLCDKLHMDANEAQDVGFFCSSRVEKRLAAKASTKARKQARNAEIVRLYGVEGLTQKAIVRQLAETEHACSLRTVASVIGRSGTKRARTVDIREAAARALAGRKGTSTSKYAKICPTGCGVALPIASSASLTVAEYNASQTVRMAEEHDYLTRLLGDAFSMYFGAVLSPSYPAFSLSFFPGSLSLCLPI